MIFTVQLASLWIGTIMARFIPQIVPSLTMIPKLHLHSWGRTWAHYLIHPSSMGRYFLAPFPCRSLKALSYVSAKSIHLIRFSLSVNSKLSTVDALFRLVYSVSKLSNSWKRFLLLVRAQSNWYLSFSCRMMMFGVWVLLVAIAHRSSSQKRYLSLPLFHLSSAYPQMCSVSVHCSSGQVELAQWIAVIISLCST